MEPRILYETVHGSRAYGLARAGSDIDHKGIVAGPPAWYFGFRPAPEQIETGPDRVLFELRKFVRLAASGNPTLLEVLFTDPADHVVVAPGGARLLAERDAFLSRRVAESFGGYALAQLKRIRTHRRWLLSPPERPPTRAEYGLPEQATLPRDQIGAAETLLEHGEVDLPPNFLGLLERERRYRGAKKHWTQYQKWLRSRNPQRAALEARFGYDTKHALHLVRLLRMGVEILERGEVRVRRPDREELLAIRDGAWTYDELMSRALALGERVRAAAATSPLPAEPDEAKLDALCIDILSAEVRP